MTQFTSDFYSVLQYSHCSLQATVCCCFNTSFFIFFSAVYLFGLTNKVKFQRPNPNLICVVQLKHIKSLGDSLILYQSHTVRFSHSKPHLTNSIIKVLSLSIIYESILSWFYCHIYTDNFLDLYYCCINVQFAFYSCRCLSLNKFELLSNLLGSLIFRNTLCSIRSSSICSVVVV